ncbi:MAG: amidase [Alphaproteobacteria bacterium]|nr:amidase [Alphaproteobacteria bacterium]
MDAYEAHDALGLAALVRAKKATPRELVDEALARIEQRNPRLNAVVHVDADAARKAAEGPLPDGPFKGVPFLIKDLHCPVAGMPMTDGSAFIGRKISENDGVYTTLAKQAGLVILGKSNTPEFGIPGTTEGRFLGPCRNPFDTDYSSGGSSGGAASATAAGIVPMAHASDGQGSIRIPACQCNLFGMKPTRGRTPTDDAYATAYEFTSQHVVSRSVRDSAAMLDATGVDDPLVSNRAPAKVRPFLDDVNDAPGRLRIAVFRTPPRDLPLHEDVARTLDETASLLGKLGHDVFAADFNVDWRGYYRVQGYVTGGNFAAMLAREVEKAGRAPEGEEIETHTRGIWEAVQRLKGADAFGAVRDLRGYVRQIMAHWDQWDVLLCPVAITPPPKIGYIDTPNLEPREVGKRQSSIFGFTPPYNGTGQPSMSVPLGMSQNGLPIGMMFTGRFGDEATLFRLAGQLEKAAPWAERYPTLS